MILNWLHCINIKHLWYIKPLTIFAKKGPSKVFDRILDTSLVVVSTTSVGRRRGFHCPLHPSFCGALKAFIKPLEEPSEPTFCKNKNLS